VICPTAQAEFFSEQDWTTQITLNRFSKLHFARIRFYQPIGRGKRIEIQNHSRDLPVGANQQCLFSRGEVASSLAGKVASVARIKRSEIRGHRPTGSAGPGFRGVYHRARIRATRWLHPGYDAGFASSGKSLARAIAKAATD
jgi:hypothetical protein